MPYRKGSCRSCGAPCEGNRCSTCQAERRAEESRQRAFRRQNGLCLTCGQPVAREKLEAGDRPVDKPARYCGRHLAYYRARKAAAG